MAHPNGIATSSVPKGLDLDLWCGPAPLAVPVRQKFHYDRHWMHLTGNGDIGNQNPHALEAGTLPASACTALHRAALERHTDAALAERAHAQFAKLLANLDGQIADYAQALANPRDRARGAALFKQHCGTCHQAHGAGVAVGPALDGEAKQPEETLLVSILAPSAQITGGYTTYTLLTTGGQVFTGLLAADTASSVTLKQQEGKTQTVLRKEIAELTASPVSLMPESLGKALSPQDVADILAWLRDPGAE